MSEEFQAIYEDGVLRLSKPLDLPEQSPVRVIVIAPSERASFAETATTEEIQKQRQALDAMYARISSIP